VRSGRRSGYVEAQEKGMSGLEILTDGRGQARRPEETGWNPLTLEPVEDEGHQLLTCEMEVRHADLGLGIQVLGQPPEAMGLC